MTLNLKGIHKEWREDSAIPVHQLDETSRRTPLLHSKYREYLDVTKQSLRRAENAQKILLKQKWLYYNGKMDQKEIMEKGWEPDPFNGLKILKGEMDYYYESDQEIQKSEDKIVALKTQINTLEDILNVIRWRHSTIKNIIDYRKFESGG
tara:strand:+ start:2456 stop:2905 length:450 start_codon:yes stop_codon:yes gene_type:complete